MEMFFKTEPVRQVLPSTEKQIRDFRKLSKMLEEEEEAHSQLTRLLVNLCYENCLRDNIRIPLEENVKRVSDEDYSVVFVWDLDDITMLSRSILAETCLMQPDIDSTLLLKLVDKVLMSVDIAHPDEIAAKNVMNIEDALYDQTYSPRYQELKNLYNSVSDEKKIDKMIISHELLKKCGLLGQTYDLCQSALKIQEVQHQRWENVKKSLDLVNTKSTESKVHKYANVVLSKRGVAQAAVELLVSRNSEAIKIENIYSRYGCSRNSVWSRFQRRFGESCRLIYITSRIQSAPRNVNIGICPIDKNGPIDYIYKIQQDSLK